MLHGDHLMCRKDFKYKTWKGHVKINSEPLIRSPHWEAGSIAQWYGLVLPCTRLWESVFNTTTITLQWLWTFKNIFSTEQEEPQMKLTTGLTSFKEENYRLHSAKLTQVLRQGKRGAEKSWMINMFSEALPWNQTQVEINSHSIGLAPTRGLSERLF